MKVLIDLILVAILVAGIVLGYKRGFVQTVAKPVKLVAVWFCSLKCCSSFGKRLIAPLVQAPVTQKLSEFLNEKCAELTAENAAEEIPTLLKIAAGIFNINVDEIAQDAGHTLTERLAETFTSPLVSLFSVVIAFVLLLLIFSVVFSLLLWLLNQFFQMRPLAWVNHTLGVIFTAALAMIIAWVFSMLVGYIFSFKAFASLDFEGGIVYRFFKTYHPLDLLLGF